MFFTGLRGVSPFVTQGLFGTRGAKAQAAAAKHPDVQANVPAAVLREVAVEDAMRIEAERKIAGTGAKVLQAHAVIDLDKVGEAEVRTLMSAKHKAFGYRPPPGPLATEVQGATAKHPDSSAGISADMLHEAAREDAARIANHQDREVAPTHTFTIDLANIGEHGAATIESAEHNAPNFRPPPSSLSAEAHMAVVKHPTVSSSASAAALRVVGCNDSAGPPRRSVAELGRDMVCARARGRTLFDFDLSPPPRSPARCRRRPRL